MTVSAQHRTELAIARPDRLVVALVFLGALVAGWVMLPGESERIAMLERDGHSREALSILENRVASGDRSYRTLHQTLALYENEGNIAKAQTTLEAMVRERPRDVSLKRRLANFYRNGQQSDAYIATLQEIVALRYSESVCREWIGLLRFKGDATAEQSALQRCRQKGYRRAEDLTRLAELYAAGGDLVQATALLKSIDDLKRLKTQRERLQLLQLLLDQDQPNEAERRALRWIRASRDDAFAIGLIDVLARSKHPGSAIEVAKDAGAPGDSISLTVAERLLERTQNGAALLYLRGWLDRAKDKSPDTGARFIAAALAAGDAKIAVQGAKQFGLAQLPERTLLALATALEASGAREEAGAVRAAMTNGAPLASDAAPRDPVAGDGLPAKDVLGAAPKSPQASSGPRARQVVLVDPLEGWRKALYSAMSSDAQKRMQALFVGPKPPPGYASQPLDGQTRGARILKKTSRVLQRTKSLTSLKAKRRNAKAGAPQSGKTGVGIEQHSQPPKGDVP